MQIKVALVSHEHHANKILEAGTDEYLRLDSCNFRLQQRPSLLSKFKHYHTGTSSQHLALCTSFSIMLLLVGVLRFGAWLPRRFQESETEFEVAVVHPVLLGSTVLGIAFAMGLLVRQLILEWKAKKLRYLDTCSLVELPSLEEQQTHHLFLSHVRQTGQVSSRHRKSCVSRDSTSICNRLRP